jgi:hypothetical protein
VFGNVRQEKNIVKKYRTASMIDWKSSRSDDVRLSVFPIAGCLETLLIEPSLLPADAHGAICSVREILLA